jgi:hypothetical protein
VNFENKLEKDVGTVTRIRIGVSEILVQNPKKTVFSISHFLKPGTWEKFIHWVSVALSRVKRPGSEVNHSESSKGKAQAIPICAWTFHNSSSRLRLPEFLEGTRRCKGQSYIPTAFTPRRYPYYAFLLEDASTPGLSHRE